jgi:GntR family transcriptional regulator
VFDIVPSDAAPIWRQIEEGMRRMIALGTFRPGDPVPSVRDLARDLRVNPATVSRAYQRLTDAGLFVVRRGEGTYIAEAPAPIRKSEKNEALRDAAARYASTAIAVAASLPEAVDELESSYDKIERNDRRRE